MELSQRHRTKVSISDFITKVRTTILNADINANAQPPSDKSNNLWLVIGDCHCVKHVFLNTKLTALQSDLATTEKPVKSCQFLVKKLKASVYTKHVTSPATPATHWQQSAGACNEVQGTIDCAFRNAT